MTQDHQRRVIEFGFSSNMMLQRVTIWKKSNWIQMDVQSKVQAQRRDPEIQSKACDTKFFSSFWNKFY